MLPPADCQQIRLRPVSSATARLVDSQSQSPRGRFQGKFAIIPPPENTPSSRYACDSYLCTPWATGDGFSLVASILLPAIRLVVCSHDLRQVTLTIFCQEERGRLVFKSTSSIQGLWLRHLGHAGGSKHAAADKATVSHVITLAAVPSLRMLAWQHQRIIKSLRNRTSHIKPSAIVN